MAQGCGQDAADELGLVEPSLRGGGDVAGVAGQAGVGVDLENPGPALAVDPEVDAGVAAEAERAPASQRQLVQAGAERAVAGTLGEAAGRGVVLDGGLVPLGRVVDDAGPPGREAGGELDLAERQGLGAALAL